MKRMSWVAVWIGAPVALFATLMGGGYCAMAAKFSPDPPAANYPKPATALEAQRQDIDYQRVGRGRGDRTASR